MQALSFRDIHSLLRLVGRTLTPLGGLSLGSKVSAKSGDFNMLGSETLRIGNQMGTGVELVLPITL